MTGVAPNAAPREALALSFSPGLLTRARGRVGVVICDTWGYDALCARRSLRILADRLAEAGYPSLRFDWPGTNDALDGILPSDDPMVAYETALDETVGRLMRETGVASVVLIGLGLGASLAASYATGAVDRLSGLVMLAPVVKGRSFLRELQARAVVIGDLTGAPPKPPEGAEYEIAGMAMPRHLSASLQSLDLAMLNRPNVDACLVASRAGKAGEIKLAERVCTGPRDAIHVFSGYDAMVGDPTGAEPPVLDIAHVIEWLETAIPAKTESRAFVPPRAVSSTQSLSGEGFTETPVLFGPELELYGVLCAPCAPASNTRTVLLLSTGGTPHVGWGRGTVELARDLAALGVTSFRVDMADIGDSRPMPGAPAVVHYHHGQTIELSAALDVLETRHLVGDGVVAVGACSGAYLAFNGAVSDERITHVVSVNLQRLLWDPRDDVATLLMYGHTSAQDYGRKLFDRHKLRRLLSGDSDALAILRNLLTRVWRRGERHMAPWLFGLSAFARLRARVHASLATLSRRGVVVELIFSDGDPGLAHMSPFLGHGFERLKNHPTFSVTRIADADHNLTQRTARACLLEHVAAAADATDKPAQAAE